MTVRRHVLFVTLVLMTQANTAHAYFDPNVGGVLYQILFPIAVAIAAGWRFVKMLFTSVTHKLFKRADRGPQGPDTGERPPQGRR